MHCYKLKVNDDICSFKVRVRTIASLMRAEGRQLFRTHLTSCILKKTSNRGISEHLVCGGREGGWVGMAEFLARRPTTKKKFNLLILLQQDNSGNNFNT